MADRTPPETTDEERKAALEQALIAREVRKEVKDMVKRGNMGLHQLLEQGRRGIGDRMAGRIHIGEALLAVDGIGPKTAAKMLHQANLEPDRRLDTLNRDQVNTILHVAGQEEGIKTQAGINE